MEMIVKFFDMLLHLDKYIDLLIRDYGMWTYLIFFVIVFCETGLVVTPFLPGDSLLFVAGTFAALGSLNLTWLLVLLTIAAILGDTINYWIGNYIGPKVFQMQNSRVFRKEYLDRTHQFYEKYGPITIVIGRFIPIIRTFAPFLAGVGSMTYGKFLVYNVVGGILWIASFTLGGYFFGNLPFVKKNFTAVIIAIIIISVMPTVIEYVRQRRQAKAARTSPIPSAKAEPEQ
jgi:membrane-associated protein